MKLICIWWTRAHLLTTEQTGGAVRAINDRPYEIVGKLSLTNTIPMHNTAAITAAMSTVERFDFAFSSEAAPISSLPLYDCQSVSFCHTTSAKTAFYITPQFSPQTQSFRNRPSNTAFFCTYQPAHRQRRPQCQPSHPAA